MPRDAGVTELIEYFDQPERAEQLDKLTAKEMRVIEAEIERCQRDFVYCARNYFWITDKDGVDQLFDLWESQELILEKLDYLSQRKRPRRLMVIKARQLGCSLLIEALIAWQTMFYPNQNALIVSHSDDHGGYLFSLMLHIYDQMPWWLKPMLATRKYDTGLHFANPNLDMRRISPGMNSKVVVQSAMQTTGVGQGYRLSAVHASEYSDWEERRAKEIIDGDLRYALSEKPKTFAILETTAKGAGTYTESLWLANVKLAERAEWYPLFLPWFFEKGRFIPPETGWVVPEREAAMRDRVSKEWVRCDNPKCGRFKESHFLGDPLFGFPCPDCASGILREYILQDDQLCWMWQERINKEAKGSESVKELRQELATTPEEAFQLTGIQVFPADCHEWVNETVEQYPLAVGNLDDKGRFHGPKSWKTGECWQEWCRADHRYEPEHPLKIWEWPDLKRRYVVGVDVSEGIGDSDSDSDFSVGWVNKLGENGGPDVHVATYRSNRIDPGAFAVPVNFLGRWYNDALMSIEYNIFQTTADLVKNYFMYPNLFRWKHPDNDKMLSHKVHWMTQINTKSKLWQTAIKWLRARLWVVRDPIFAEEMKRFQKEDYEDKKASAASGSHDDVIMAAMIALYTSHDLDWDEAGVGTPQHIASDAVLPSANWMMRCRRCDHAFPADKPSVPGCPNCGSIMLSGRKMESESAARTLDFQEMAYKGRGSSENFDYDLL
jgi:hypothetical protein